MLIKRANLRITTSSVIDRDILLFGPKKTAFIKHDISGNLIHASNSLNILAEIKERNPEEWIIFRARAIDADIPNDNGDMFSEKELLNTLEGTNLKSFETFINVPFFTNHKNDDIEEARGKVVSAFYDLDNHCVYVDAMVDAKAYPNLARGIREGYIQDVSMGAAIKYSVCSICGNKAHTEKDYCSCIKNHKGKKLGGKKVYESNYGVKFIELSGVTDGACENCTIQQVYTGPELLEKIDSILIKSSKIQNKIEQLRKVASKDKDFSKIHQVFDIFDIIEETNAKINFFAQEKHSENIKTDCLIKVANLQKEARGEDVDKLNKALDLLKEVADQILNSKDVDFEFVEDIGSLLSDLQNLIVDLVEAGYANQITNPSGEGNAMETPNVPETANTPEQNPAPMGAMPPTETPAPIAPAVTPTASNKKMQKNAEYLKGLEKLSSELNNLVHIIRNSARSEKKMPTSKEKARNSVAQKVSEKFASILDRQIADNEPIIVKQGDYSVSIDVNRGIRGFAGKKEVVAFLNEDLGEDILTATRLDPQLVAEKLIEQVQNKYDQNGEVKMGEKKNITKEALITNVPPVGEVQERQLENLSGNFERKQNEVAEPKEQLGVTTEAQLENVPKSAETGNGNWGRSRPDNGKIENLPVTEAQLNGSKPTPWGIDRKNPEQAEAKGQLGNITERQFDNETYDFERWDSEVRAGDKLPITEGQFEGKDRQGSAMDEVQEGQLEEKRLGTDKVQSSPASPHKADYSARVVKAFLNGLANAVINQEISPKTLSAVKPTLEGIKTTAAYKIDKKNITVAGVRKLAESVINEALGKNIGLADPYLEDTIGVLYEDKNILAQEIGKVAEAKLEMKKKAAKSEDVQTVEQKRESSIRQAWKSVTAAPVNETRTLVFHHSEAGSVDDIKSDPTQLRNLVAQAAGVSPDQIHLDLRKGLNENKGLISIDFEISQNTNQEQNSVNAQPMQSGSDSVLQRPIEQGNEPVQDMEPAGVELAAEIKEKLQKIAEKNKMKKEAQSPAGTTLPPPGGAPMGAPAPGAAPGGVESLTNPPAPEAPMEDQGDEFTEDEMDGEAKPFGSCCPVCNSDDADGMDGKFKCNSCGAEWDLEVNIQLLNPEKLDIKMNPAAENETEEDGMESEGEELNDAINSSPVSMQAPAPPAPAAGQAGGAGGMGAGPMASVPSWVKTAAYRLNIHANPENFKGVNDTCGHVCPQCNSKKVAFAQSEGQCAHCGTKTFIEAKNNNGELNVLMTVDPNLVMKKEKNAFGGHAFNGECEDSAKVREALHKILSHRKNITKVASIVGFDPMFDCMTDQIGNGYMGEDAIQICASIKDFAIKLAAEDKDEDKEDKVEFEDKKNVKEDDDVEFDDGFEEIGEDEDSEGHEKDESEEFEAGEQEGALEGEDDEGLEHELTESPEFEAGEEEGAIEGLDGGEEIGDELNDDFSETQEINVENINSVVLEGTDAEGNEFQVKIPTNMTDGEEVFDGEPEDVSEIMGEDEVLGEEESFGEEEAPVGEEEEFGEEEGEVADEENILNGIFTTVGDEEEVEEEGGNIHEFSNEEDKEIAANTTEFLRKGKIASAGGQGGSTLDWKKLAQLMGTMPLDTEVDVPRKASEGVRQDGEFVHSDENKNTAKQMTGTAAGSTVAKDEAIQGSARGVEVIKPQPGRQAKKEGEIVVEAKKNCPKCKCAPCKCKGGKKKEECGKSCLKAEDKIQKKTAQQYSVDKVEPIDALQEDKTESTGEKLNVPRNEAKAKPEIDVKRPDVVNPTEVRKSEYGFGEKAKNLHTEVVPRDGSGDGLGGESVSFDKEVAENRTSGNPDSYVQEFQDQNQIAPTPAGSKDNHAVASIQQAIKKIANKFNLKVANLEGMEIEGEIVISDNETGKVYRAK